MNNMASQLIDQPAVYQIELVRTLARDPELFQYIDQFMDPGDFDHPVCQLIYDALQGFYRSQPDKNLEFHILNIVVLDFVRNGGRNTAPLRPEEYPVFEEFWQRFEAEYDKPIDTDYFRGSTLDWVKRMRTNTLMRDTVGAQGPALDYVVQRAAEINELGDKIADPSNVAGFVDMWETPPILEVDKTFRIGTGLRRVDMHLPGGGLGLTQIGCVIACPGVGKTTTLMNIALAAQRQMGVRALFITCEMVPARINHRNQAVAAHIPASLLIQPVDTWDTASIERYLFAKNHAFPNGLTVYDASTQQHTTNQIDVIIRTWQKNMEKLHGEAANAHLVCVDWIHPDYLKVPGQNGRIDSHILMASLAKQLAQVARDTNVLMWTACQANRGGANKEVLTATDIAGGFDIHQPLDLAIALAPKIELQGMVTPPDEDEDAAAGHVVGASGRNLCINSVKIRDGEHFKTEIYQSPTMRFFDNQRTWQFIESDLNGADTVKPIREDLQVHTPNEF